MEIPSLTRFWINRSGFLVERHSLKVSVFTSMKRWPTLTGIYVLFSIVFSIIYFYFPKNALNVDDQPLGQAIKVKRVTLDKGGFIVIQKGDGEIPEGVGHSEYLPPGNYFELNIELKGKGENGIKPGDRIWLTLYQDNGDLSLTETDVPVKKINGKNFAKQIKLY